MLLKIQQRQSRFCSQNAGYHSQTQWKTYLYVRCQCSMMHAFLQCYLRVGVELTLPTLMPLASDNTSKPYSWLNNHQTITKCPLPYNYFPFKSHSYPHRSFYMNSTWTMFLKPCIGIYWSAIILKPATGEVKNIDYFVTMALFKGRVILSSEWTVDWYCKSVKNVQA